MKIFDWDELLKATFVKRPNRFIVIAELDDGPTVKAYMPNTGRLQELLLPGVELRLVTNRPGLATSHTAVAVRREGRLVLLHTHLTNLVARRLIEAGKVKELKNYTVKRAEVPVGRSRFDFLLERSGKPLYLEVKSCTLFGNRVAMFPDAVTERGRRHLEELAVMSQKGIKTAVMFVIHCPDVSWFMPDYHTDLKFSLTLLKTRKDVQVIPVSIGWTDSLELRPRVKTVAVPWEFVEREACDRGAYLLILRLKRRRVIDVGELGKVRFEKGWYIYVGSAMKNLGARTARHLRLRKRMHWHVDWLRAVADKVEVMPIRSSVRIECQLASEIGKVISPGSKRFGSTDCKCGTHLFHSSEVPQNLPGFHDVLQKFRMKQP